MAERDKRGLVKQSQNMGYIYSLLCRVCWKNKAIVVSIEALTFYGGSKSMVVCECEKVLHRKPIYQR